MNDTIKVEILQEFKHGRDTYFPSEVAIVDYAVGEFWCRAGWAKDTSGIVPTGTPSKDEVVLLVQDVVQVTNSEVL
jgi:hypothetical protein